MKASQYLAVAATLATTAIAGPVKHAKFHHKPARHAHISANTTAPYLAGSAYGYGSAYGSASPDPAVAPAAAPTTTAYVEATETRTDTLTNTVTVTIGTGASAVVTTTTSLSYELVEVIVKYVTVYVTDYQTVPAPTPAVSPNTANAANSAPAAYNAPLAPSPGPGVEPSTPADGSDESTDSTDGTLTAPTSAPLAYNGSDVYNPDMNNGQKPKPTANPTTTVTAQNAANTVAPPAQTGAGTIGCCNKWYVAVPNDYCYLIATKFGIDTDTFMSWNPSVGPNCATLYPNYAYCIGVSDEAASSSSAVPQKAGETTSTTTKTKTTTTTLTTTETQTPTVRPTQPTSGQQKPTSTTTSTIADTTSATTTSVTTTATSPAAYTSTQAPTSATTASAGPPTPPSSPPSTPGNYDYVFYKGDGTEAMGWPSQNDWVSFEEMWNFNLPIMSQSCSAWNVPNNSDDENNAIKDAINQVSAASGVDPRFILAIIMQESNGCVRVITTVWSFANPGLMQTNQGKGSCNEGGNVQTPCPSSEILQMVQDGTLGTATGDGLKQTISESGASDVSMYYKGARIYNGGLGGWVKTDLGQGCCTKCYASDVANRLRGWHSGPTGCTL